jgi:hypothetical protein
MSVRHPKFSRYNGEWVLWEAEAREAARYDDHQYMSYGIVIATLSMILYDLYQIVEPLMMNCDPNKLAAKVCVLPDRTIAINAIVLTFFFIIWCLVVGFKKRVQY